MRTKQHRWTQSEMLLMSERFISLGALRVSRILGLSRLTVQAKASKMGLKCACRRGCDSHKFTGYKDVSGELIGKIKKRYLHRGYAFDLTAEFIYNLWQNQNRCCYYSGREIGFKDRSASIDRLDASKGYTQDNVVIVHRLVNRMKLTYTHEQFLSFIHQIHSYHEHVETN